MSAFGIFVLAVRTSRAGGGTFRGTCGVGRGVLWRLLELVCMEHFAEQPLCKSSADCDCSGGLVAAGAEAEVREGCRDPISIAHRAPKFFNLSLVIIVFLSYHS